MMTPMMSKSMITSKDTPNCNVYRSKIQILLHVPESEVRILFRIIRANRKYTLQNSNMANNPFTNT